MNTVTPSSAPRIGLVAYLVRIAAPVVFAVTLGVSAAHAADIPAIYQDSCAACHDNGALNAPKKGDTARWQALKDKKGMPALVQAVKGGMIQMPAGGLCATCTNDDYRQLIDYMSK
ncbi:c-type cytochrome [Psychrobacter aestuarii]|uniref:Cytochrome c5 family protein n=1 Tax=Psychrobacter aestuarii TaxID=556327 RepID=A0ABN0VKB9_9GAMM|nr:c-type cytochrome [Psychrobacter aestuarii]